MEIPISVEVSDDCVHAGIEYCHFPFTYKGVVYTQCTDEDNNGILWCAVERDDENMGETPLYCPCKELEEPGMGVIFLAQTSMSVLVLFSLPCNCAAVNLYSMRKCALCYTSGVVCCTRSVVSVTSFSLEMKNIGLILCEVHSTL